MTTIGTNATTIGSMSVSTATSGQSYAVNSGSNGSNGLLASINQLPNDLLANKEIFTTLLGDCESVWHQLNDNTRQQLVDNYLPKELSLSDKEKTIQLLLSGQLNRFNNDLLSDIFVSLKTHKMSPDLLKALEDVKTLKKKLFAIYEQKRQSLLLNEVIHKRRQFFDQSIQTNKSIEMKKTVKNALISESKSLKERVRERYRKELKDICNKNDNSSEEEDYDLKHTIEKSLMSKLNGSINGSVNPMSDKQYFEMLRKHKRKRKAKECNNSYEPTLEIHSITLSDIITRVTNTAITTNSTNTCKTVNTLSQTHTNNALKSSSIPTPKKKAKHSTFTKTIQTNQTKILPKSHLHKIKVEKEVIIESELSAKSDVNNKDSVFSINDKQTVDNLNTNLTIKTNDLVIKSSTTSPKISSVNEIECPIVTTLPPQPVVKQSTPNTTQETVSPAVAPPVVYEKAPKCFFSLLRDIFMSSGSSDQRLTLHKLEELVKEKLRAYSPHIGWSTEMVASAMNYLSGVLPPPHLVPLVDYKEKNQQWQWIGGGRDRDQELIPLSDQWIKNKDEDPTAGLINFSQTLPPPAKCLTDWIVKPSSDEEKSVYRKQEAVRYNNPYKAFTYKVHGYESVVGPVKGCGIGAANGHNVSSPNKAREHSLLVNDRPPFVTLLSLVRDAAARLPNGEGTRADICELLKDSQYLLPTISDQQVNGIVSGALDRLHYEKDPCVKYDVNRKVWIYLHRNRTEGEFERLHEVQIAAAKAKRSMTKASRKTNCVTNQSNQLSQTTGQLFTKTTQQAIHQAVTNILNSEALKLTTKSASNSSDNCENPVVSGSTETVNLHKGFVSDLKTSILVNANKEKDVSQVNSLSPFNGSTTATTLTSNSLFLSLQANNQIHCKTDVTSSGSLSIDKKKPTKPKDNKVIEPSKNIKPLDIKQSIIVSTNSITQSSVSLSIASTDGTNTIKSESNVTKVVQKPRQPVRQTKPPIKVQFPKAITLPIPITQNTLKAQPTITTCAASEVLPTLISVTNPSNKTTTLSSNTESLQQRPLTTKLISGPYLNSNSGSGGANNQMHQISIPTSVLFGARPGSVVLATPTGKSYMMAAAGGSIVLQPNSSAPSMSNSSETTGTQSTQPLAVRTLQGIRVIPVNANPNTKIHTPITAKNNGPNAPVVMATQPQTANIPAHHQFVARIITTAQTNRGNIPQTQIVIPSTSSLQPLFIAHPSQSAGTSQPIIQQLTTTTTTTTAQLSNDMQKTNVTLTLPRERQPTNPNS
ncbi:unnamed protein product [Medioppia subpectinata]|uniref:NFRKB n=1 Tax=Medioppia subpectinata TaxID=1979941 RepID=A0A7R9KDX6_9ACAR|nr:unnamed protein product [Medioppia subpectinata]CAG2101773.1 unnamed protein product [Medioppia subpectinata]